MVCLDTRVDYMPNIDDLRPIIVEALGSMYSIHPGSAKMYHDLKEINRWEGMKRDISKFVEKCPSCQQFNTIHLKHGVLPSKLTSQHQNGRILIWIFV